MGQRRLSILALCATAAACASNDLDVSSKLVLAIEPNHDFGEVGQGVPVEHTFEVRNVGTDPLLILPGRGSCGCAVSSFPTQPLGPGGQGEIAVRLDTSRMTGKVRQEVRLTATCGTRTQELNLGFEGTIRPLVIMTPDPIHFGAVALGASPSVFLDIVPAQSSAAKVAKVELDDPRFDLTPIDSIEPGHYRAQLTLRPTEEEADIEALLRIELSDAPASRLERFVRARVRGDLLATQNIYLQRSGADFEPRSIPVTSRTGRRTLLTKAFDPLGLLNVAIVDKETPHALVRAQVAHPLRRYEPAKKGFIEIETASARQPRLKIAYVIGEQSLP
ncbi:MAG: DUF1573 domain-containing protein [Myxococcota bacterium]|jgi:hypothetical protein|nr:DUF1573 domain-containing protein [Myxococcota bacterium]